MTAADDFQRYFAERPLVAIIRGVTPAEAEGTARAIEALRSGAAGRTLAAFVEASRG